MSKGYFLDKWLTILERIHSEMDQLFIRNRFEKMDLSELKKRHPKDYRQWIELHKKSNRVASNINKLILT